MFAEYSIWVNQVHVVARLHGPPNDVVVFWHHDGCPGSGGMLQREMPSMKVGVLQLEESRQ